MCRTTQPFLPPSSQTHGTHAHTHVHTTHVHTCAHVSMLVRVRASYALHTHHTCATCAHTQSVFSRHSSARLTALHQCRRCETSARSAVCRTASPGQSLLSARLGVSGVGCPRANAQYLSTRSLASRDSFKPDDVPSPHQPRVSSQVNQTGNQTTARQFLSLCSLSACFRSQ